MKLGLIYQTWISFLASLLLGVMVLCNGCEPTDTQKFAKRILRGDKGEGWEASPYPNNELVKGKKGKYFDITINQIKDKQVILFKKGCYTISDDDAEYKKALNNFGKGVVSYFDDKSDYEIFVKGSADILGDNTFHDTIIPAYNYSKIEYFSGISDKGERSLFSTEISTQAIPYIFNNSHLPNLRGKFIQEEFFETYDRLYKKPIILEGSVTLKEAAEDRNVNLFLYISDNFFDKNLKSK